MALIDAAGQVLAAPDYEDPRFESVNPQYEPERDAFTNTYSPGLPPGLNLGRQLFYLKQREPKLFEQVAHILPLPQFWAWRLSGVMASEVTSLGCHSDLWSPPVLIRGRCSRGEPALIDATPVQPECVEIVGMPRLAGEVGPEVSAPRGTG